MILRRTASGLAAMHLFFRVDVVVYCEGGQLLGPSDVQAGHGDHSTLDVLYWSSMVGTLNLQKSLHFKSVGDKPTLAAIAHDVASTGLTNITVCLDQDYDVLLASQLNYPRVAYSFGYSWESDVVEMAVLNSLFTQWIGATADSATAIQGLITSAANFAEAIAPWCETDIVHFLRAQRGIFDRRSPLNCCDHSIHPPILNEHILHQRLAATGNATRPAAVIPVGKESALRVCHGKTVSKYLYRLFISFAQTIVHGFQISYDVFMRSAIAEAVRLIKLGTLPPLGTHLNSLAPAFA